MSHILVTYATLSGTTVEVAKAVGQEIAKCGAEVDVLPVGAVKSVDMYDGVVVGAPMIAGWHRNALGFLRRHRTEWQTVPLAVFITAMSLTRPSTAILDGVPLCIDEGLPKPPARADRLNFRERYARVENYARPILGATRPTKPVSVAFFGGRLEYGRLPWWAVLFAMLVVQAPAGDKRNWPFIRSWASNLPTAFAAAERRT
jgi:menaquinone-dependent protoporphyrinogen IX oxidase